MAFEIIGPRLAGSAGGIGGSRSASGSSNIHAQVIHWLRLDKVGVWDTVSASNTSWQSCVSCCGSWILRLEVEPWPKAWPTLVTYHVWRKHVLMIGACFAQRDWQCPSANCQATEPRASWAGILQVQSQGSPGIHESWKIDSLLGWP